MLSCTSLMREGLPSGGGCLTSKAAAASYLSMSSEPKCEGALMSPCQPGGASLKRYLRTSSITRSLHESRCICMTNPMVYTQYFL